ncbi:MAG: hypothetical protein EPO55_15665 [Reyranella sp.]|uniref:hypothetical protein n=1 Tax=Reyranella sp. TaxID=1929291 RepID=UPI0011F851D6|nr:hypothetical protein [Reyranella sp.]TAJ38428.1 MAG: hypothetical protein EPO55_15665 [Reyranella sp.]
MALDRKIWLGDAFSVLDAIADRDVLHDAWSGKSNYPTSPEEIYNEVFSDSFLGEYARPELGLDEAQKMAGKEFVDRMRDFDKIGGPELPWQEVIDHPGWVKVREAAGRFLALLRPAT